MAAIIGALRAELSATIARFQEDMGKAAEEVRQFVGKVEKQGKRLTSIGSKMSIAITAPLVAFGTVAVREATAAQQALAQVEAALVSTGNRAGKTRQQLMASAKALETISLFDDDDILAKSTANLLKFGNVVGDVFDKAQLAIVNMSARTGKDLVDATQTVGRALNDPIKGITALTRAGVQFTTQQQNQIKTLVASGRGVEAQAIILGALEKAYGGAAKALRDATPTAALNQQWRELTEIVGGILLDILPPVIELLKLVAEAFNSMSPEMQALTVYAGLFAAALGPLLTIIGSVMRAVAFLTPIVIALATAIGAVTVVTWGWIAAIAAAVAALVIFWKSVKDILHGDFEKAWEDAKTTAREMWDDLRSMFENKPIQAPIELGPTPGGTGPKPATPVFSMPTDVLAGKKTFETDLRNMAEKISSAFRKVDLPKSVSAAADLNAQIDEMVTKAEAAGVKTGVWADELAALRARIEGLKLAGLAKEATEFGRAVDEDALAVRRFASGSLDPFNEKIATIDQAYAQLRAKIEANIEDNRALADVSDAAAAAMKRLEASLVDLEKAHGAAREAAVAQWQAEQDLASIQSLRNLRGTERDIEDLRRARGDFGPGQSRMERETQAASRDLLDTELATKEQIAQLDLERTQAELTGDVAAMERLDQEIALQTELLNLVKSTTAEQIVATERMNDVFDGFFDSVESELLKMAKEGKITFGGLREAIREMLFQAFVAPHIEQAGGLLRDLAKGAITGLLGGSIGGGGSATFDAGSGNWTPGPEGFPTNAAGGFIPPGQWETAGEQGPELLFGGKKGVTVFSNADSQDMIAGAGASGTTIFQNFNIRTNDASSFMRTQRQIARQSKRELQGA
jgi:hypothetical protein